MTQMRHAALLALLALAALAACGADGAPKPPAPGITMGGSVAMGIARNGG